jgi:hypothetical protein
MGKMHPARATTEMHEHSVQKKREGKLTLERPKRGQRNTSKKNLQYIRREAVSNVLAPSEIQRRAVMKTAVIIGGSH